MKIMVIIGSVRTKRTADVVTAWLKKALRQQPDVELDIADLSDIALPFYDSALTAMGANGHYDDSPGGTAWAKRVSEADGYVFIVAEYNHGYTAVLKNAIDWVNQGWHNKPVAFVSYGGVSGGIRAVEQLRQVVLEVRLLPLHDAVHVQFGAGAFEDNGEPKNPALNDSLQGLIAELTTWTKRLAQ